MAKRTYILEHPYYRVCLPGTEQSERLTRYLRRLNVLLDKTKESLMPYDSTEALMTYRDYQKAFDNKFGFQAFTQNRAFVTVGDYLEQFYPLKEPFTVLSHCLEFHPYETFCYLQDMTTVQKSDLPGINAALEERVPFRWWSKTFGPRYWLFGPSVWELGDSEFGARPNDIRFLVLEAMEREKREVEERRRRFDQLRRKHAGRSDGPVKAVAAPHSSYISEEVRTDVWQRDQGRCVKCGGQEGLAFDHIIPVSKGGSSMAKNIHLLCEICGHQKAVSV